MNTTFTRRAFLARLTALAAAPLLAKAALTRKESGYTLGIDPALPGSDKTDHFAWSVVGPAIKVPSNRWPRAMVSVPAGQPAQGHVYVGDWDGTFKLERGCTNPAYILVDLIESTRGARHDWVTGIPMRAPSGAKGFVPNWQMLYDWGRACDKTVPESEQGVIAQGSDGKLVRYGIGRGASVASCHLIVHAPRQTHEERVALRETLRMHCLSWQSTDPRYRTSWPGIPYPEERA